MTQNNSMNTVSDVPKRSEKESLLSKFDIPIDHLDFAYVKSCKNGTELEKILHILRSGQEGYFPDLLKCVEEQLCVVKPKSKFLQSAVPVLSKQDITKAEWNKLSVDMQNWINDINKNDEELASFREIKSTPNEIPVRQLKPLEKPSNTMTETARIKSMDYQAWDKLDVDAEILKMDLEEERMKKENLNELKRKERLNTVVIDPDIMTDAELSHAALTAKHNGNEYYRLEDYEEALVYYSDSISLKPMAATYNNRAMTNIKLEKYHDALHDCDEVLKLEPCNEKALYRKALALKSLRKLKKAVQCLGKLIQINPCNTNAQSLINALNNRIGVTKPVRSVRIKIEDEKQEDKLVDVIIPVASTSTWPGPYYKVMSVPETVAEQIANRTKSRRKSDEKVIDLGMYDGLHRSKDDSIKPIQLRDKQDVNLKMQQIDKQQCVEHPNIEELKITNNFSKMKIDDDAQCSEEPLYEFNVNEFKPYMFITHLQALKHDRSYIGHEKLLRLLTPNGLATVLGCKLDSETFSAIIKCLNKRFCNASDAEYLKNLLTEFIKMPRFKIILLFMDNEEKHIVHNLIAFIKKHGYELREDVYNKYSELI